MLDRAEFCRIRDENAMREIALRGIAYAEKAVALWKEVLALEEKKEVAKNDYERKQLDEAVKALAWQWQMYEAPLRFMREHYTAAKDRLKNGYPPPAKRTAKKQKVDTYALFDADGDHDAEPITVGEGQLSLFEV